MPPDAQRGMCAADSAGAARLAVGAARTNHNRRPLPIVNRNENHMNLHLSLTPLISLLAGILILVMPKLLNFIVAVYLILIGLIGLFGAGGFHLR